MIAVGVLCRDEREIILLVKGWTLVGLIVPLTEVAIALEIRVVFLELHAQSLWLEGDSMVMIRWL